MSEIIKCPTCKTEFEAAIDNCDSCGFPFAGTDKEKSVFIGQQIMKKGKISETKKSINQTRIVLFVIAAFYIIVPFLQYSNVQSATVLIALNVIVGLVFLTFGVILKIQPFIFILIPLLILIGFYTLAAIIDPLSLMQGLLWKALFISSMLISLKGIWDSEKIKKESGHLASKNYK
ncbi:MAG: hypothetical protein ACI9N1_000884 [Flavobacteriales bacterium]|jgi:hypothetical protein